MFTQKKLVILNLFVFVCLRSHVSLAATKSFEEAVAEAKKANLTQTNEVHEGVPFYSVKTLDPNWQESGGTPIVSVSKFNLKDQNGSDQTETLLTNKITFVAFFFSSCAGFCPTLLKNLQRVQEKVSKIDKDIQFVAISVDPERDKPEALKAYFKKMELNDSWKLLTGDKELIYSIARDTFAAEAFQLPTSKGQIAHSEHFYVLDGQRRLRGILNGTRIDVPEKADQLIAALKSKSEGKSF